MNEILLKPVASQQEWEAFWRAKDRCFLEDTVPQEDLGTPLTQEDRAYFLSEEYRGIIRGLCSREVDPALAVFFERNGERIGFCLLCTYHSEDQKCFILDFCVFSGLRGRGLGTKCFQALKTRQDALGAAFYELNTSCRRSMRFWEKQGFRYNGYDESGSLLMLLPPENTQAVCQELAREDFWQVLRLENGCKGEAGAPFLSQEQKDALEEAVLSGDIRFFVVKRSVRVIGMCSVSRIFSTLSCQKIGILGDFFMEPAFRKQGHAKALAQYVQKRCALEGLASLWALSPEGNLGMYEPLGFSAPPGHWVAWNAPGEDGGAQVPGHP
ncbi:MAG: GNAT family N-acetyltransferase [Candidatus Limiplasma sp.]|nr:GNAT family N-acetyltransferase [Candidatus Limiplasma sp.]